MDLFKSCLSAQQEVSLQRHRTANTSGPQSIENALTSAAYVASQANEEEVKYDDTAVQPLIEEEKLPHLEIQPQINSNQELYRRYSMGSAFSTEFGLQQEGKDIKIEINCNDEETVKVMIDDRCYDSGK